MSGHLYTPGYNTRLGNLTAKSVLVRICDQANDDTGFSYPSFKTIAKDTEVNLRTVRRVVEVFAAMGLVKVHDAELNDRYGKRTVQAITVNLDMLGRDLTEEFARCYAEAQGKTAVATPGGRWCLRDTLAVSETLFAVSETAAPVSETLFAVSETAAPVSETLFAVSETIPPHPLIGGSCIDPSPDPALSLRACGNADFTPDQQEHLDRLAGDGRDTAEWKRIYAEQNREVAAAAAAELQREAELRKLYPDRETAIARLRKECGFAWAAGDELGPVLEQVFRDQEEMGKPSWRVAAQMVSAWMLQRGQGKRLRARFGPMKFFRDGHWLDPDGWHWSAE